MDLATAQKIVSAFCAILEKKAGPVGTQVADVSELPYPKDQIKEAFLCEFVKTPDAKYRELLGGAYVSLADWQIGVGPRRIGPAIALGQVERLKAGSNVDLTRFAKEFGAQFGEYEKWKPVKEADQKLLLAELERVRRAVE